MCTAPNKIPNPYYRFNGPFAYLHDCQSQYMYVPCGVCKECIALKQMYLIQRVQMEARNSFLFFSTLTYNNEFLPHYDLNDWSIPYADIHDLQLLFKRLRNNNSFGRPFRYFACTERGGLKGRPHVHILWFLPRFDNEDYVDGLGLQGRVFDSVLSNWCRNVSNFKRCPDYKPLLTYKRKFVNGKIRTNYDTHFVIPSLTKDGISSVAFYVAKYLLKPSSRERRLQQAIRLNYDEYDYEKAYSVVKSRSLRSEHFGLNLTDVSQSYDIVRYLRECINRSRSNSSYPLYFSPDSNLTFPLSPYYKSKGFIYSFKDSLDFKMKDDSIFIDFDKSWTQIINADSSLDRLRNIVDSKDLSLEFDFND